MISAAKELLPVVGVSATARALNFPRASLYRVMWPAQRPARSLVRRCRLPDRALSPSERADVLALLHSERFIDKAPAEVVAILLDEGKYLCSERTMYRILKANNEVKERRNQARHPSYKKPELQATRPNQVWSWDITKLRGPVKWVYYHLYVILDIYSRYVVGWMVASREKTELAKLLIRTSADKQGVEPGQLCLHADRGSSMKAKSLAQLLTDLGILKSHSRPHVSDDNPFSESQFKTLKYRPDFPDSFGSIQDARAFCSDFFNWYNNEHRHSGIAMLAPAQVHYGNPETVLKRRHEVMLAARQATPERFPNGEPRLITLPPAAWINKPPLTSEGDEPLLP